MADATAVETEPNKKSSKTLIILSLILGLAGAGAGFYLMYEGLIPGMKGETKEPVEQKSPVTDLPEDIGFVPIDPLMISLGRDSGLNLRFRAQLEIREQHRSDVEKLMPRVVDVLNSYLRAVDIEDIEGTASLVRLRAQMLRRIQVVTGMDRVQDLLVMEFVVN